MAPAPRFVSSLWSFFRRGRRNPSQPGERQRVWRAGRSLPLTVEQLEARNLLSATLLTDRTAYAPGENAVLSGSGFQPGETIDLQVVPAAAGQATWRIVDGGAGDADGAADGQFRTSWILALASAAPTF